jgi:NADH dehydrogenase [ubiquinone] 1 alpha subcomplex assembly factor 5
VTPPPIFDATARRIRRDATTGAPEAFLTGLMIDELVERVDMIKRSFADALVIGAEPRLIGALTQRGVRVVVLDPSPRRAAFCDGRCADEDDGSLLVASYDLVIAIGTLDTVADLPGALTLIRRALRPDGVFLAAFPGAGSLPALRAAVAAADSLSGAAVARFHPQIDVRAAGDLLVRAGFTLPVADVAQFELAYASIDKLLSDLRDAAMRNILALRYPVGKGWRAALAARFASTAADQARVRETIAFNILTGWAPAPGQPQPARRGSATASLTDVLKQRGEQRD